MIWMILGVVVLFAIVLATRKPKTEPLPDDERPWEDWEERQPVHRHAQAVQSGPAPALSPGQAVLWPAIEDLMWAAGYSRDEVWGARKAGEGYISIFRNGVEAAFAWYGDTTRDGDPIYHCESFDPQADTSKVDRWSRPPSEDERRAALWRSEQ